MTSLSKRARELHSAVTRTDNDDRTVDHYRAFTTRSTSQSM